MIIRRATISLSASLAVALCLLVEPAMAQTVTLDFAPQVGAGWKVTQTRTQTKSKDGGVSTIGTTISTLRVLEETADGYLMEWKTDSVSVKGVVIRNQPEMMVGVPIHFDADASGLPIRVHDGKKIIEESLGLIGRELDPAIAAKTRALFAGMDEASLAGMLLKDVGIITQCHDFEIEVGADLSAEQDTPNALGGPPIKSTYTVKLEDAGGASTPARLHITQALDPQSAAASMYETIKKLSGEAVANKNLRDGKLPKLIVQSSTVCLIDRASGAAISVLDKREATTGDESSSDVRKVVLEPL